MITRLLLEKQGVDTFILHYFIVLWKSQVSISAQTLQPKSIAEMQMPSNFRFHRINQPKPINRLKWLLSLELFKHDLLPVIRPNSRKKSVALNMIEPNSLPKDISYIILLPFEVGVKHYLTFKIEANQRLHFRGLLGLSQGQKSHFGTVKFSGEVNILIEFDFHGYLGLILKAGEYFKEGLAIGQL